MESKIVIVGKYPKTDLALINLISQLKENPINVSITITETLGKEERKGFNKIDHIIKID